MTEAFDSRPDRYLRGGALAAVAFLAASLLAVGVHFYWPSVAAAQPADAAAAALTPDLTADASSARSTP